MRLIEGCPVVSAVDLGNEPSNLFLPQKEHLRLWLDCLVEEIKRYKNIPVTLGGHQEDLFFEGPFGLKDFCDFLSIHAYPFYLTFLRVSLDSIYPLFLVEFTRWLSGSSEEFEAPSKLKMWLKETVKPEVILFPEDEIE